MALTLGASTTACGLEAGTASKDWKFIPLTTDKGAYIYSSPATGNLVGRIVTSNGTSIATIGASVDIVTEGWLGGTWNPVKASSAGFVVPYAEGTPNLGRVRAVSCTVSGTTITAGVPATIISACGTVGSNDMWNSRCGDDKCVIVYQDGNASNHGTAIAFTVSGTTVDSPGSPHVFENDFGILQQAADEFFGSDDHVLAVYSNGLSSNTVFARVLNVSGTTTTSGCSASATAATQDKDTPRCTGLTSTNAFIYWEQSTGARAGKVRSASRSGTTIDLGTTFVDWATDTNSNIPHDATRVASDLALLLYSEGNNNLELVREIRLSSGEPNLAGSALTLEDPSELNNMGIAVANTNTTMVVYSTDQIAILTTDLIAAATAFRLLGLAADSGHLYATGLEDSATLKLYDYALADFSEGAASSFGSATDAQVDAASRGIFPVTRPGAGCYLYLRGRDGNNVQAQKNDMNSASGWQDIGAGSATWNASKMAVGLHPSIFDPDDLLAAFTDNDVYRTRDEGTNWTSQGSTTGSLLTSTRHPVDDNKLLVGGSAPGSIDYSHNYGVSFEGIDIDSVSASRDHRVLASGDDGYVAQSPSLFVDDSTIVMGNESSFAGDEEAWLRFSKVAIAPSSVIDSAYIQFEANQLDSGSLNLIVYGEDADNPTAISSFADFNGRTRTSASVAWSPSDPWTAGCTYTTPDISTVAQEIIDRSGWSLNNAMQFFVEFSAGADTERVAKAFDTASTLAPLLHIESTGSGGVINHIEVSL